jgi:ElaA protein
MELTVKTFDELTTRELYEIYRVRSLVFVVEQKITVLDMDEDDLKSYHLWLSDEGGIEAYLRIIPHSDYYKIGRVLSIKRRCGVATQLLNCALDFIRSLDSGALVKLEGQTYAKGLYSKVGFVQTSEEFMLDGISHIKMEQQLQIK